MRKYIICILSVIVLLQLVACSSDKSDNESNLLIVYKGKEYNVLRRWYMINDDEYSIAKASVVIDQTSMVKEQKNVRIYSGTDEKFILAEFFPGDLLFYKAGETLPSLKDTDTIEIVFSDVKKNVVILEEKLVIEELVSLMSLQYQTEISKKNSISKGNIAAINIYFKNYPAYYFAASIIKAKDGSYGFVMSDWYETMKVGKSDYIKVPSDSRLNNIFNE